MALAINLKLINLILQAYHGAYQHLLSSISIYESKKKRCKGQGFYVWFSDFISPFHRATVFL